MLSNFKSSDIESSKMAAAGIEEMSRIPPIHIDHLSDHTDYHSHGSKLVS